MSAPERRPTVEEQQAHRAAQPPLMDFLHASIERVSLDHELNNMRAGIAEIERLEREEGK